MKIGPRVDAPNTSEVESQVHSTIAGYSAGQSAPMEPTHAYRRVTAFWKLGYC